MKRGLLFGLFLVFSISIVSAAYYGYGGFSSLGDILDSIDEDTMVLGAIFIVSFAIINYSLSRFFKDSQGEPNKKISGVIAFTISLFIAWGINRSGYGLGGFLYDIGLPVDLILGALPLIILGGLVVMGIAWGFGKALFIVGWFLIAATFFVYNPGWLIFFGLLFIVGGAILWIKHPKKGKRSAFEELFGRR